MAATGEGRDGSDAMQETYAYVWEFLVRPEACDDFERMYGPQGPWVELFRRSEGFLDTRLLRDRQREMRYITIDRWRNEQAYRRFRSDFADEYSRLDRQCEHLTLAESSLGEFRE